MTIETSAADARSRLRSGRYLPGRALGSAALVVIVALEHGVEDVQSLAEDVASFQLARLNFKPVFLVSDKAVVPLGDFDFVYETLIDEDMWSMTEGDTPYDEYRRKRIHEMHMVYAPRQMIILGAGSAMPHWALP